MKRPAAPTAFASLLLLLLAFARCSEPGSSGSPGEAIPSPEPSATADVSFGGTPGSDGGEDASGPADGTPEPSSADGEDPGDGTDPAPEPEPIAPPACDGCAAPAVCIDGFCVTPEPGGCAPGEVDGCFGKDALWTCDDTGTAYVPSACPKNQACFDGVCKPVICVPEKWLCEGLAMKKQCNSDGTGFLEPETCPEKMYCTSGKCAQSCSVDPKFGAYVGCHFWTVDLPNYPDPTLNPTPENSPHAVVISNPAELPAEITFEVPPGTLPVPDGVVAGLESKVFVLPIMNVAASGVSEKGIRVSSTRPVLVHQFNPWDNKYSNDASLLLPENFLGSDYVVLSWPTTPLGVIGDLFPGFPSPPSQSGYFTVLAVHDDTKVTIQVTSHVESGPGTPELQSGSLATITLQRGEVLNVEAEPKSLFEGADLTGSTVSATKPVAVFGGHEEAAFGESKVPPDPETGSTSGACCADHLEEQLLPMSVLGETYLAIKAKPRGTEPDVWRIQAAAAGVTVTTNPPQPGASGVTLAKKGAWIEVTTPESFEVHGTGKLQVAQYLVSQEATEDWIGDPSMILAVPVERFRKSYALMVPSPFEENYVTVVKAKGSYVEIDGGVLGQSIFQPLAGGDFEYAYVSLQPGIHQAAGDQPFGLSAYGFNTAVSYGYPGGLSDASEE